MWLGIGFVIGMVLASFAQVLADRSLTDKSFWGRSYCMKCKKTLKWYDLFPIFSFLILKGRCRFCKKPFGVSHLITEIIFGIVVGLYLFFNLPEPLSLLTQPSWDFVFHYGMIPLGLFVITIAGALFLTDMRTYLLPNRIIYPSILIAFLYQLGLGFLKSEVIFQQVRSSSLGEYLLPPHSSYLFTLLSRVWMGPLWALGAAALGAAFFIFLILITRGRGMGWGDVKYVFFLGIALGFPGSLVTIFLAFLTGAVFAVVLLLLRLKRFGQLIPFGPFISIGAVITLIWGPKLLELYLSFSHY